MHYGVMTQSLRSNQITFFWWSKYYKKKETVLSNFPKNPIGILYQYFQLKKRQPTNPLWSKVNFMFFLYIIQIPPNLFFGEANIRKI